MKTITVNDVAYRLEFGFDAAEHKNLVQDMFRIASGAYFVESGLNDDGTPTAYGIISGTASMVADVPRIAKTAFYAGLLENNAMSETDAYALLKEYMKENKLTFYDVYTEMKECMESDGFFDLSGITAMLNADKKEPKKTASRKTSTSTK